MKGSDNMATLAEALIGAAADLGKVNTLHQDSQFVRELPTMIQKVASDCVRNGTDLNDSIYKIAKEKGYNEHQIQRLAEESNNQVYMAKYAAMKGNKDRDVKFKLADPRMINARLKGGELEKKASVNIPKDAPVFQPHYANKYVSLAPEKKTSIAKIAAHKAVTTINTLESGINKIAGDVAEGLSTISQSLILQENFNKNAQQIFDEVCKKASLDDACIDLCIESVKNNLGYMKKNKEVNSALDVEIHKYNKTASFDSGKYSFAKEASYIPFSKICTPNGNTISEINELTKIACEVQEDLLKMAKMQSKLKYIKDGLGLE